MEGALAQDAPLEQAPREAVVHSTDVAIIGGGLAGSLAAAMLGRAGIDAILVDPHVEYQTRTGRPVRLVPEGKVIDDLFA